MGLLLNLLALPLMGPVSGLEWVARQVQAQRDEELYDYDKIRTQLAELNAALERAEITEEAFEADEEELIERLHVSRSLNAA